MLFAKSLTEEEGRAPAEDDPPSSQMPFFVLQSYRFNFFCNSKEEEYKRIKNLHFSFPSVCIKVPSGKSIRKKGNPPWANVLI